MKSKPSKNHHMVQRAQLTHIVMLIDALISLSSKAMIARNAAAISSIIDDDNVERVG